MSCRIFNQASPSSVKKLFPLTCRRIRTKRGCLGNPCRPTVNARRINCGWVNRTARNHPNRKCATSPCSSRKDEQNVSGSLRNRWMVLIVVSREIRGDDVQELGSCRDARHLSSEFASTGAALCIITSELAHEEAPFRLAKPLNQQLVESE